MAFAKLPPSGRSHLMTEINITPLTDIFLVLLIIFMITSSAMIESGGKVNLPKAVATQSESRGTTVTLSNAERSLSSTVPSVMNEASCSV